MSTLTKQRAITIWAALTAVLWTTYSGLRLTIGGQCPNPDLQENFDRERYLGRWYEMFRHYDVPYEYGDCATATYSERTFNRFEIDNVEYLLDEDKWARDDDFPLGKGIVSNWRSGLANVKFFELAPWAKYMVLATDYDNYSVVYNCDNFAGGMVKVEYLWILTRVPEAIGSTAWNTMRDTVWAIVDSKVGDRITPATDLRPTE